MSRWLKWIYSIGLFLSMCGILMAGTYQYLDHLNIPYNINLFTCGSTASCTAMVIQDSGGVEKLTPGNPAAVMLSPNSIGVGAGQDGWNTTEGTKGDSAYTGGSGSITAILKGIWTNLTTPISVTPNASPQGVAVVNTANALTTPAVSPQNVTVASSPVTVNVGQIQGTTLASPTTYGVSPTGSVGAVNAFVTNQPTVALSGSPVSVGLATGSSPVSVGIASGSSPINVTGNLSLSAASVQSGNAVQINSFPIASPTTYGVAPSGSVGAVNAFITNQPTVVLSGSPVSVGIASGSSPINVTGTFTANSSSPTNVNLDQVNGQLIASPQTYGVAPVGSVLGVNAFVTNNINATTTPSVSPQNVTIASTPLNVTMTSPVSVAISTVSSPINVTGSLSVTAASPQNVNLDQINGQLIASPQTYGVAPNGSVMGVNAFVTNQPTVVLSGSPVSVGMATGSSPVSVALQATPANVTLAASPLNVTVGGIVSPQNVTLATGVNITAFQSINIASPSTYGVAPVGSVPGFNAFVTNSPTVVLSGSPVSVGMATGSSPVSVALQATPANVTIASTPLNVTLGTSPLTINLGQVQSVNIASPATYGVAPVGSVEGVNAFVTNSNPNGLAVAASSQPVVIASNAQAQIYATLPTASHFTINGYVATTAFAVTNTVVALGATPGIASGQQLTLATCVARTTLTTPQQIYLQIFDTAPHPSGTDVTLATTKPKIMLAISGSPISQGTLTFPQPGAQFVSGISIAVVATNTGSNAAGTNVDCSFTYGP